MKDQINLSSINNFVPKKILTNSIKKASEFEIMCFAGELCELEPDQPLFRKMIELFFQHSGEDAQQVFFRYIRQYSEIFSLIIHSLPSNLTILNLHDANPNDDDLIVLTQLNGLKLLNLNICRPSNSIIEKIAGNPHVSDLEKLYLEYTPITDEAIIAIANSPHMAHLESLDIRNIRKLTDKAIVAIENCSYLNNLLHLFFTHRYLSRTTRELINESKGNLGRIHIYKVRD